jgi:Holliday junction resolvasome RuvABC endonuclease subunit
MIVLGVDPGYRNLGLTLVRVTEDGNRAEVVHSENMAVGKATAPMAFTKFLWPKLQALHKAHGPIEAVASETPPFIMGQIRTTAFLWAVSSIIVAWAHSEGIPFRHASPISLKRAVCRATKRPWNRKYIPTKSEVKLLIAQLLGTPCPTSHENDAALAAITMFSALIPDDE